MTWPDDALLLTQDEIAEQRAVTDCQAVIDYLRTLFEVNVSSRSGFRCAACRRFMAPRTAFALVSTNARPSQTLTDVVALSAHLSVEASARWCLTCMAALDGLALAMAVADRLYFETDDYSEVPF